MELKDLKGLGPSRLETLRAMGITSLRDFLYCLPLRYEDMSEETPCKGALPGMMVLVRGHLEQPGKFSAFRGLTKVTATLVDDSGKLPLVWYNQPWMAQQVPVGEKILLYGRVGDKNQRRVLQNPRLVTEKSIQPVYRKAKEIPPKTWKKLMEMALEQVDDCCPETLPVGVRLRHHLCELNYAIRQAHFPSSMEALKIARRRIAFEQMLLYQAAIGLARNHHEEGFPLPVTSEMEETFWNSMPFAPTGAQRRVLAQIAEDLRDTKAMRRMVQGDVGCGKTAIAFGAIVLTQQAGFQSAMMAPTEILARQHYESAKTLLAPLGITCGLLTGSMKVRERREALAAVSEGRWDAIFGTHALISEGVTYKQLGLVVTDEQHRFGVNQRSTLQEKGRADAKDPHVLVMSATPIPRTLALILYGDLDISVVDQIPPGRTPVKTRLVPEEKRAGLYDFLRAQVQAGRQAYVVCPLVEESERLEDVRSAKETYYSLRNHELKGLRVALTWGDQPAAEKAEVLRAFAAGETDVLVSTTVIEVGVNVPNASVMVIENAERYGLSQLHQLRGRVGRGSAESWCFLLGADNQRLRTMTQTNDGFEIARKDLALRGPGDLMGTRQSGETMDGFVLDGDVRLLEEAVEEMKKLREIPELAEERKMVEEEAKKHFHGKVALN